MSSSPSITSNPEFIRLVMIENIHHGCYLKRSRTIRELNRGAIEHLERVLERGRRSGAFRLDADSLVVHWQISAFSFFNVSNTATFSVIFGDRLSKPSRQTLLRRWVAETVLRSVLAAPELARAASSALQVDLSCSGVSVVLAIAAVASDGRPTALKLVSGCCLCVTCGRRTALAPGIRKPPTHWIDSVIFVAGARN